MNGDDDVFTLPGPDDPADMSNWVAEQVEQSVNELRQQLENDRDLRLTARNIDRTIAHVRPQIEAQTWKFLFDVMSADAVQH